jgi:phage baseplate assembly protein W
MLIGSTFKETTLAFPFKVSAKGTVATVNDQNAIWSNKVKSVIGTLLKERVMTPAFGSRLNEVLWNTEGFAKQHVREFISQAFITWLPTLTLDEVIISDVDNTGELTIQISYTLPNNSSSTAVVGIVGVSGNLQPTQEIL